MRRAAPGPSKGTPLTSKPLCTCKNCTSKKCPNILDKIAIPTVEHNPPRRRPLRSTKAKVKKKPKVTPPSPALALPPTNSVLEVLRKGRACGCEVVSRAAAGSLHRLVGLQDRREDIVAEACNDLADDPDAEDLNHYRSELIEDAD